MDIQAIRRARLRQLINERFEGRQVRLADAIDRQADYVSRCLKGTKGIGEELARDIERRLKLDHLWLDRESDPDPNTVAGLLARIAPILDGAPDELRQAVLSLAMKYERDPADGARIVAAIRALVGPPPDDPTA